MSKTFTSRPAVQNTRGRGRGRGTGTRQANPTATGTVQPPRARGRPVGAQMDPEGDLAGAEGGRDVSPQRQQQQQRMSYQPGGYTLITPNEKKRQEVTQMARREEEMYRAHRQQNTQTSYNIVGTAGGGQMTEAEARRRMISESPSKTQRLLQAQQMKSEKKRLEDEENQKKKATYRQKAEENKKREAQTSAEKKQQWNDSHRRVNDAFLKRLENQGAAQRPMDRGKQATSPPVQPSSRLVQSPGGAGVAVQAGTQRAPRQPVTDREPPQDGLLPEERRSLDSLVEICGGYSRDELLQILRQVNFSVDQAIDLLQ